MLNHLIPSTPDSGYALVRELGRGAAGAVYEAVARATGRRVAVKFLAQPERPDDLLRFRREARILRRLVHPNVLRVLDAGTARGVPYLVTELCTGDSLADLIARGPLSAKQVAIFLGQILAGLEACHLAGIIHRDLKPGNILIRPDGQVVIADFGLASDGTGRLTQTGMVVGTPRYLAPELALGHDSGTPDSDVYAVGCVAFEMLTGHAPYALPTIGATLRAHIECPVPDLASLVPEAPERLVSTIRRALIKNPLMRPTVAEMLALIGEPAPPRIRRPKLRSSPAPLARDWRALVIDTLSLIWRRFACAWAPRVASFTSR